LFRKVRVDDIVYYRSVVIKNDITALFGQLFDILYIIKS